MNIGDKVRSLRGNEEGIITSFISSNEVEVEIEDGFRIPYMKSDLVRVHRQEADIFTKPEADEKSKKRKRIVKSQQAVAEKGFYLVFAPYNDQILDVLLVNNTDLTILYTLGEEHNNIFYGIHKGIIEERSFAKAHQMTLKDFDEWPTLIIQGLFFNQGIFNYRDPQIRKIKFKANTFYKSKQKAPLIEKEGYVFQIDLENLQVNPQQVRESLMENKGNRVIENKEVFKPKKEGKFIKKEVDLHSNVLALDPRMSKGDIIEAQLLTFEKELDQAILMGMDEITFIHGVGNGRLKEEIQKRLSKHQNVDYFKDARKEKFGYGATLVRIK